MQGLRLVGGDTGGDGHHDEQPAGAALAPEKGIAPVDLFCWSVLIVALAIGIVGGGIVIGRDLASSPTSTPSAPSAQPTAAPPPPATLAPGTPAPADGGPFAAEFASLAAELDAKVGIVVRPVGAGPAPGDGGRVVYGHRVVDHQGATGDRRSACHRSACGHRSDARRHHAVGQRRCRVDLGRSR